MTDTTEQQAVTVAHDITRNPEAIWLSPICDDAAHHGEGRTWAAPAPDETCEDCSEPWVEYVRSDLASVSSASAEGFVLVPRVPTEAMVIAGCGPSVNLHTVYAIWSSMLAASPEPVPATNQAGKVERLAKVYADATGYYVDFHRGLSSPSADKIRKGISAVLAATQLATSRQGRGDTPCEKCQGNGEIVTDWDRYTKAQDGDKGDEGTADCPDCDGTGRLAALATQPATSQPEETWMNDPHSLDAGLPATSQEGGKSFASWSTETLAQQCRMQARDQLDPDLYSFLAEVADRLAATPTPPTLSKDLREALDAAHYYIDASDQELSERGITRDDALGIARDLRAALAAISAPSTVIPVPKTAKDLTAIIEQWLAQDGDWGEWEKALDALCNPDDAKHAPTLSEDLNVDAIVKESLSIATLGTPGQIAVQIATNAVRTTLAALAQVKAS